ncbi:prolyl oligopeptidase family protein [Candidatus Riflebacteria bacterium]
MKKIIYPKSKKVRVRDNYHGTVVADPYRWLEDIDSKDTKNWIKQQNRLTHSFLNKVPERQRINKRLKKLWNYEKFGLPFKKGGYYFFFKNNGLQNHSVLYFFKKLTDKPKVLLDPNKFSKDGTVALTSIAVSPDGKFLAYGISKAGSDWQEWKVRSIKTGKDLNDHLKWIKFSGASFSKDSKGFYYCRYEEPKDENKLKAVNYYQKLYYHKIGDTQVKDELIYERPDQKEWGFGGEVTDDGRFLLIHVWKGTENKNLLFYKDLKNPRAKVTELIAKFEASYSFIGNEGDKFYLKTDYKANQNRLIQIDLKKPTKKNWQEVIAEEEATLEWVSYYKKLFIASYLKDAHTEIKIFNIKGQFTKILELPDFGTAYGFLGHHDEKETFFSFTSFTRPPEIYRLDLKTLKYRLFRKPEVNFNALDFVTRQVFFRTKDRTWIPMFITYKRGLKQNADNPVYLYGYGGFNFPLQPGFSVANLVWMEMGGIYVQVNLRGGGEYGKSWHQAGTKENKQNVFDDFIATAEWLIANKYTNQKKLAIAGGSNGGLLVGACLIQRPDLFGACLPLVGVLDMLRFHKFTVGWAWVSDYGSSDNKKDFKYLYAYSPVHNLKKRTAYPPTMIMTGDHDDRVFPAHSFKFAARMQECQNGENPVLIHIETKAGHGMGKPTMKIIQNITDKFSFLVKALKFSPFKIQGK